MRLRALTDREIPGWEFEMHERPSKFSALFRRDELEPSFASTYQDKNHALRRMIRRLSDYDADTFKAEPAGNAE
jgi:hypothetical protein